MKGSFVCAGLESENIYNNGYEFDVQSDFSQFLEEAKRHSSHNKESPTTKTRKAQNKQEAQKSKKSWKHVLFPFWRSSSSKKHKETSTCATNPKPKGYVSGPIYETGGATASSSGRYRNRLMGSGPLTDMFRTKKREEDEIGYVSLEKLNKPLNDAEVYGPLYLVS